MNPNKKLIKKDYIIGFIFLALIISSYWIGRYISPLKPISLDNSGIEQFVRENIPETVSYLKKLQPFPHYELNDNTGETIGYVLYSEDLGTTKTGYGGEVPLLISTDTKGKIISIQMGPNKETSVYLELIESRGLFDALKNYEPAKGININTISGATQTSTALIEGTIESIQKLHNKITSQHYEKKSVPNWTSAVSLITFFILVAVSLQPTFHKYRKYWLIFSVIVLGFIFKRYFSVADVIKLFSGQIPRGNYLWIWIVFIGSVIGITIIRGRIFCWHICPFGALIELISSWQKKPLKLPKEITFKLGWIKFILLGISSFIVGYKFNFNFISFEPFSLMFRPQDWLGAWQDERTTFLVILGTLLLSVFIYRAWCSFFCPAGAFLNILSRFGIKNLDYSCPTKCKNLYTDDDFYCVKCSFDHKKENSID